MADPRSKRPAVYAMSGAAAIASAVAASLLAACAPATATASTVAPKARAGQASAATAGDSPPGFWYGTDSTQMAVGGSGPYTEPVIGGNYGGYVGMAGNWAHWQNCGGKLVWSSANAQQAATNDSKYGKGVGVSAYWFMAGPGVDPHFDGTVSEATAWGQQQAARAIADVSPSTENYPVLWMDIELPGNAPTFTPAPDNGWNSVYMSPCSGKTTAGYIDPAVDRAVVDGFSSYLTTHSSYQPGVYSAPSIWRSIFGTGSAAQIPGIYEWTYTANASLAHPPSAWCLKTTSTCAHFFGGQQSTDKTAVMWQWSGGGGAPNGYGDFDQIDGARTP
ncbi:MAG: hypothetical protein ACR2FU_24230 [Streptosporangiaceae bacterium]